jgi:nicotinamidase-related amidase
VGVYEIDPARTALLLIDAQQEYFSEQGALHTPTAAEIEDNLVTLCEAARGAGMLTVTIQHVHRSTGVDAGRMGDFDDPDDPGAFVAGTPGST